MTASQTRTKLVVGPDEGVGDVRAHGAVVDGQWEAAPVQRELEAGGRYHERVVEPVVEGTHVVRRRDEAVHLLNRKWKSHVVNMRTENRGCEVRLDLPKNVRVCAFGCSQNKNARHEIGLA